MRLASQLLAVTLCFTGTGCTLGRKKPQVPVPAAPPAALPERLPSAAPETPAAAQPVPQLAAPQQPPPSARRRREPIVAPSPASSPATAAPPTLPPPSPARLEAILGGERLQQFQADLKRSLDSARAVVARSGSATLTPAQRETVARMQTFIQQAETAAEQDLATAVQFARRAELLGQELSRTMR